MPQCHYYALWISPINTFLSREPIHKLPKDIDSLTISTPTGGRAVSGRSSSCRLKPCGTLNFGSAYCKKPNTLEHQSSRPMQSCKKLLKLKCGIFPLCVIFVHGWLMLVVGLDYGVRLEDRLLHYSHQLQTKRPYFPSH